jgi:hypothetical protein
MTETPREAANRYLALAQEARAEAAFHTGATQAAILKNAERWMQLAVKADEEAKAQGL